MILHPITSAICWTESRPLLFTVWHMRISIVAPGANNPCNLLKFTLLLRFPICFRSSPLPRSKQSSYPWLLITKYRMLCAEYFFRVYLIDCLTRKILDCRRECQVIWVILWHENVLAKGFSDNVSFLHLLHTHLHSDIYSLDAVAVSASGRLPQAIWRSGWHIQDISCRRPIWTHRHRWYISSQWSFCLSGHHKQKSGHEKTTENGTIHDFVQISMPGNFLE